MPRAAVFLLVAATAFVLAQAASAAEQLGLSVDVERGTVSASVDIATPQANASEAASVDQAAPSVSAAVETGPAAVRVDAGGRPPTASQPAGPDRRARMDPGTHRKGPGHLDTRPHDRPVVAASPESAISALEAPAPLVTRAAGTRPPSDVGLASLPERSAGGWGASVEAAATGISGSPLALAGLLLVAFSLVFRSVLGAVPAPRPSLHSSVLQRPG
jgi:hypothetical protein